MLTYIVDFASAFLITLPLISQSLIGSESEVGEQRLFDRHRERERKRDTVFIGAAVANP